MVFCPSFVLLKGALPCLSAQGRYTYSLWVPHLVEPEFYRRDCLWIDQNRKQLRLPAPTYIDLVMSWVQGLVEDESIFPTKSGE
jgi:hypothetical protein